MPTIALRRGETLPVNLRRDRDPDNIVMNELLCPGYAKRERKFEVVPYELPAPPEVTRQDRVVQPRSGYHRRKEP